MPANALRSVFNNRQPVSPQSLGPQALTTTPQLILEEQNNGDTRWVLGGSCVNNYTDPEDGGGPCRYTIWMAPSSITSSASLTDEMIFRSTRVGGDDFHQIGEFPLVPNMQLWGSAELNNYLNVTVMTEDVE